MIWTYLLVFALGVAAGAVVGVTIRLTEMWEEDEDD